MEVEGRVDGEREDALLQRLLVLGGSFVLGDEKAVELLASQRQMRHVQAEVVDVRGLRRSLKA